MQYQKRFWLPVLVGVLVSFSTQAEWKPYLDPINYKNDSSWKRMLMHLHNVFSHDACDDEPQQTQNGEVLVNLVCMNEFQDALCRHHIDIAFMTEHRTHLGDGDFNAMMESYDLDSYRIEDGQIISGQLVCENGHEVLFIPGSENSLMPVGLKRHPVILPDHTLKQTYHARTPEAAKHFRDAGAIVGVNHLEDPANSLELLREIEPEFLEAYNMHANIEYVYGDRDPAKILYYLARIVDFILNPLNEPDLYYLGFLRNDEKALKKWAQLSLTHKVTGLAGSDMHQNVSSIEFNGERVDSYRRMMRWVSNYIEVDGHLNRQNVLHAIEDGKINTVFEIFGSPDTFEFMALAYGKSYTGGQTVSLDRLQMFHLETPWIQEADTRGIIYRATEDGWEKVHESYFMNSFFTPEEPGVYRAEVQIQPRHLRGHMPLRYANYRWYPWIYSNPIYVE